MYSFASVSIPKWNWSPREKCTSFMVRFFAPPGGW